MFADLAADQGYAAIRIPEDTQPDVCLSTRCASERLRWCTTEAHGQCSTDYEEARVCEMAAMSQGRVPPCSTGNCRCSCTAGIRMSP